MSFYWRSPESIPYFRFYSDKVTCQCWVWFCFSFLGGGSGSRKGSRISVTELIFKIFKSLEGDTEEKYVCTKIIFFVDFLTYNYSPRQKEITTLHQWVLMTSGQQVKCKIYFILTIPYQIQCTFTVYLNKVTITKTASEPDCTTSLQLRSPPVKLTNSVQERAVLLNYLANYIPLFSQLITSYWLCYLRTNYFISYCGNHFYVFHRLK